MEYKFPNTSVPLYSQFVQLSETLAQELHLWHSVELGLRAALQVQDIYDWCDQHVMNTWCTQGTRLYFKDKSDATQVAVLFGGVT